MLPVQLSGLLRKIKMASKLRLLASKLCDIQRELEAVASEDSSSLYEQLVCLEKRIRCDLSKEDARLRLKEAAAAVFGTNRSYNIILADPAWSYRTPTWRGGTGRHYKCMELDEMIKLPVLGLAAEDAVLLMWSTWPKLDEAMTLIRQWGFTFKTVFTVWVKQNKNSNKLAIGNGCYTRANNEPLLLATRGLISRYQQRDNFVNVYISRRQDHSAKPDAIYEMIFDRFGDLPRIELFCRKRKRGWDAWGNECENLKDATTKETKLKAAQDKNSILAHKIVRGKLSIQKRPCKGQGDASNHPKRARVYAQTISVSDDS